MNIGNVTLKPSRTYKLKFKVSGDIGVGGEEYFSVTKIEGGGGSPGDISTTSFSGTFDNTTKEVDIDVTTSGFPNIPMGESRTMHFKGTVSCNWPQRYQDATFTIKLDKPICPTPGAFTPNNGGGTYDIGTTLARSNTPPNPEVLGTPLDEWLIQPSETSRTVAIEAAIAAVGQEWYDAAFSSEFGCSISDGPTVGGTGSIRLSKLAGTNRYEVAIKHIMAVSKEFLYPGVPITVSNNTETALITGVIWESCNGAVRIVAASDYRLAGYIDSGAPGYLLRQADHGVRIYLRNS